jgi:4-alpha-glucanotransferase
MRSDRHQYTIAYLRNHLRYAQLLRIDHVMGLHRLFCIPDGQTGDKGVYVKYPANELYAILSLESHRSRAGIIGENLGIVPRNVNVSMARHNIQRMYIVQFEIAGDSRAALRPPPRDSVASLNTHDIPPFKAFWNFADIDDRVALKFTSPKSAVEERKRRTRLQESLVRFLSRNGHLPKTARVNAENVLQALLSFLSVSPAKIVLVNLEDLWQEIHPQNVPSTRMERPNWRRRFQPGIEQMMQMPEVTEALERISKLRKSKSQRHVIAQRS